MIKYLVSILIIGSVVACGPKIADEKLAQIDELESSLDSAAERIMKVDSAMAFELVNTFEDRLAFLQYELKDTLPREEAFFVDGWFRMRKSVRKFSNSYVAIVNELKISQQQLKDLRFDAENGLVENEQFDDYVALEKENVEKVSYAAHDMMGSIEKIIPLYEKRLPRVDSLINTYKVETE